MILTFLIIDRVRLESPIYQQEYIYHILLGNATSVTDEALHYKQTQYSES
jgi:hypothetical protein